MSHESKLFIAMVKPHKAATSSTIARWLRTMLEQAGIDLLSFGARSTRGASASAAARGGITTEDILKAANWSSESVFQKFYHKEVDKAASELSLDPIPRIARSKLQTTQLMCETEPSDI